MSADAHLIATIRAKMEYVQEDYTDDRGNKRTRVVKVGMKPVQREGMEYEFSLFCDIDQDHRLVVSKGRVRALDGKCWTCPGDDFAAPIYAWLKSGDVADAKPQAMPTQPAATAPTQAASAPATDHKALMAAIAETVKRLEISKEDAAAFVRETTGQALKELDDIALAAIPAALEAHFGTPAQAEPEAPADDLFGDEAHTTPAPAEAQAAPTTDEGW